MAAYPTAPAPTQAQPFGLDSLRKPRRITWAVRSRSIEVDIDRAPRSGFDPGLIIEITRTDPKGLALHYWKLSFQTKAIGDGVTPFMIDWGASPHPSLFAEGGTDRAGLRHFSALHPDSAMIQQPFDAIGAELPVRLGKRPHLSASLTGPQGTVDLI